MQNGALEKSVTFQGGTCSPNVSLEDRMSKMELDMIEMREVWGNSYPSYSKLSLVSIYYRIGRREMPNWSNKLKSWGMSYKRKTMRYVHTLSTRIINSLQILQLRTELNKVCTYTLSIIRHHWHYLCTGKGTKGGCWESETAGWGFQWRFAEKSRGAESTTKRERCSGDESNWRPV